MLNYFFTPVLFLFFTFANPTSDNTKNLTAEVTTTSTASAAESAYGMLDANSLSLPEFSCFSAALDGFTRLKEQGVIKKDLLTVIDFSKSSNTKRLWIIDMAAHKVLFNTLVAHGRNSGDEFANSFSNIASSNMSSLGFYATGEIYNGKHGASLKLDGLEQGVNSNARNRAVVMHAADYVSEQFIKMHHRLGRSQGCPALPNEVNGKVINLIKGKSCLFIYHPSRKAGSSLVS